MTQPAPGQSLGPPRARRGRRPGRPARRPCRQAPPLRDLVDEDDQRGPVGRPQELLVAGGQGLAWAALSAAYWPKPNTRDTSRKVAATISQKRRKAKRRKAEFEGSGTSHDPESGAIS